MSGQTFDTIDVLRLDIEDEPTGLRNAVQNPNGDLGGFGWVTPVPDSILTGVPGLTDGYRLRLSTSVAQPVYAATERINMTTGKWIGGVFRMKGTGTAVGVRARWEFLGLLGNLISSGPQTTFFREDATSRCVVPGAQAPAGTLYGRLRLDLATGSTGASAPLAGSAVHFGDVTAAVADTNAFGSVRRNKVLNPSLETNLTGYVAGFVTGAPNGTVLSREAGGFVGSWALRVKVSADGYPITFRATGIEPISPGKRITGSFRTNGALRLRVYARFGDVTGAQVGPWQQVADVAPEAGWQLVSWTASAPSGASQVELYVDSSQSPDLFASDPGQLFDAFLVEQAETNGSYFDGASAIADGYTHTWEGTAHASPSRGATANGLDYIAPIEYLSILGTAHTLKLRRDALDVGSLTVNIADSALDPAKSAIIRPGRQVVLSVADPDNPSRWEPLFTGYLQNAQVEYDLKSLDQAKRARIEMVAIDSTTKLANVGRSEGVADIAELPAILEGAGVPWNVNGSGDQVPTAVIVARNDNASVLDQVGITRDSQKGFAWVDRRSILQVWDRDQISTALSATLTDADYTDLAVDYDTERCINSLLIINQRINPATGETEELQSGPYTDQPSITEWGPRSATMTIQGIPDDMIGFHALDVLARNSTPQIRVNALTMPIRNASEMTNVLGNRRTLIDLMDLVRVTNVAGEIDTQLRVQTIQHTITAKRWDMSVEFIAPEQVASPAESPPVPEGSYGRTLAELLRPVGEITMFWGGHFDVPPGWLVCNGTAFDTARYPKLYEFLGTNLVPDLEDRVPVGASFGKASKSSGGSELKTLPAHFHDVSMPNHEHYSGTLKADSNTSSVTRQNGTNATNANPNHQHTISGQTGQVVNNPTYQTSDGGSAILDVMQPWRALLFIIRGA